MPRALFRFAIIAAMLLRYAIADRRCHAARLSIFSLMFRAARLMLLHAIRLATPAFMLMPLYDAAAHAFYARCRRCRCRLSSIIR